MVRVKISLYSGGEAYIVRIGDCFLGQHDADGNVTSMVVIRLISYQCGNAKKWI
jgi:hypothetical protein